MTTMTAIWKSHTTGRSADLADLPLRHLWNIAGWLERQPTTMPIRVCVLEDGLGPCWISEDVPWAKDGRSRAEWLELVEREIRARIGFEDNSRTNS